MSQMPGHFASIGFVHPWHEQCFPLAPQRLRIDLKETSMVTEKSLYILSFLAISLGMFGCGSDEQSSPGVLSLIHISEPTRPY